MFVWMSIKYACTGHLCSIITIDNFSGMHRSESCTHDTKIYNNNYGEEAESRYHHVVVHLESDQFHLVVDSPVVELQQRPTSDVVT